MSTSKVFVSHASEGKGLRYGLSFVMHCAINS